MAEEHYKTRAVCDTGLFNLADELDAQVSRVAVETRRSEAEVLEASMCYLRGLQGEAEYSRNF